MLSSITLLFVLAHPQGLVPPSSTAVRPCASTAKLTFAPFAARSWYAPLIAEPRAAQFHVVAWGHTRAFPYMTSSNPLTVWEFNVGKELPLAAWDTHATLNEMLDCRGWGFGAWVPGTFNMITDAGHASAPILNHDFRLAGAFKMARAVTPRDLVSGKVQFGHESTHIGDEFLLDAQQAYGAAFLRINVSYEYLEAGVNWEHFFGGNRQHSMSARFSAIHALPIGESHGWYTPVLDDGTPIQPSTVNFEPAVGVEYLPRGTRGWRPFVSYEGRLRTVYDYQKSSADQREDRQFSSSVVVGLRNLGWASRGMPDFIAKGYWGVNPNGQFRSQSSYWMFGLGLLIRL